MRRLLVVVILAAALVPFIERSSWACECVAASPKEQSGWADVVFTGNVSGLDEGDRLVRADFEVDTSYKGKVASRLTVITPFGEAACGYTLQKGERVTIFASHPSPTYAADLGVDTSDLETNLCRGNVRGAIDASAYGLVSTTVPHSSDSFPRALLAVALALAL